MPEGAAKETAKQAFCDDLDRSSIRVFGKAMGLKLGDICLNSGLRQTAKLTLNSFYGKFGTSCERDETCFFKTFEELKSKTATREGSEKLILDFVVSGEAGEPVTVGRSASHNTRIAIEKNTNVYVAAFVTAYGRIKLYLEALKKYQEDAIYCDTDSIFVRVREDAPFTSESFLGGWEHESKKVSKAFASLGPKVYVMETVKGDNVVKAKGIKVSVCFLHVCLRCGT